jgi:hypothetical protein
MKDLKNFDFYRAKMLMDIIVQAGQHGPIYHKILGLAQLELQAMVDDITEVEKRAKIITPPAGPSNSMVEKPSGEKVPITPKGSPQAVPFDPQSEREKFEPEVDRRI